MTRWFIPAMLAVTLMCGGSIAINAAAAAPAQAAARQQHASKATDLGARGDARPHRYVDRRYDRPYDPYYYDRPHYYAPAPFFPFLPFLGFGYGPWW